MRGVGDFGNASIHFWTTAVIPAQYLSSF